MRADLDDDSTKNVTVHVFAGLVVSAELEALLDKAEALQAKEGAYAYNSKGKSGGYFNFVKITGPITAIASALAAFFKSRQTKFFLNVEIGKTTVMADNYSAKEIEGLIKQSTSLQITESPDELATFGSPEDAFTEARQLKGFAEGQPGLDKPN